MGRSHEFWYDTLQLFDNGAGYNNWYDDYDFNKVFFIKPTHEIRRTLKLNGKYYHAVHEKSTGRKSGLISVEFSRDGEEYTVKVLRTY